MNTEYEIKQIVKEKYTSIATQSATADGCCDGAGCCSKEEMSMVGDDYSNLAGYQPEADLGLGCGLPTQFAGIRKGDTVIDLGSGAGNDVFIARREVGEQGKVVGVDFTEAMIEKARQNAEKLAFNNVEFRLGDIESLPVTSNFADVVLSNCVLNLVPNKYKVFSEIFRVLKPGAHFSISDIVLDGELPEQIKKAAELYAGCISGAVTRTSYLRIIEEAGFGQINIQKERRIQVPDLILLEYISAEELAAFKESGAGVYSITISATKPAKDERNCCEPGNICCS